MKGSGDGPSTQGKVRELSLSGLPKEFKIALLKELGYDSDGTYVMVPGKGERLLDRYSSVPIAVDNMVILPGNSPPVILDDSPLSLSQYLDEFGDIL